MKHFINERGDIVREAIDAAITFGEGKLARLDGYPSIKVVLRSDWDRSKVAIVSGGGAGHEPAHVGFVGDGMLTAAVCGEIFASPSVDAVLAAILAVTGPAGCLLVVKNYTGDRLNFGLAAEKARAMGLAVEMVIVGDDVAIANAPRPRGVAGTLFVHKVAGHLARQGASLAAVRAGAERVANAVVSLGLSLSSVTIPGQEAETRMRPDEVELGLGIHGEPGARIVPLRPVRELALTMVKEIEEALVRRGHGKARLALLLNDLGSVPPIEMALAGHAVMRATKHEIALVYGPARLMTSLDMKGFSISALPLDAEIEAALASEVGPRAWPLGHRPVEIAPLPLPAAVASTSYAPSEHAARRAVLEIVCTTLIAKEKELDALDAKIGDGDTGTTFATAARSILADLDALPLADPRALCGALADRLSKGMGGSIGILLAIFVAAMQSAIEDPPEWSAALHAGIVRVMQYGGAKEGDRTMLDALVPAAFALQKGEDLAAAARAARAGADRTTTMTKAMAGRASYMREDALRGVADPGAVAVAAVFEALAGTR